MIGYKNTGNIVPGIFYRLTRLLLPASEPEASVTPVLSDASDILVSTLGSGMLVSIVGSSTMGSVISVEGIVVAGSVVGAVVAAVVGAVVAVVVGVVLLA